MFVVFFFQAEDGIRDLYVTGVQTCALPISRPRAPSERLHLGEVRRGAGSDPFVEPREILVLAPVLAERRHDLPKPAERLLQPLARAQGTQEMDPLRRAEEL